MQNRYLIGFIFYVSSFCFGCNSENKLSEAEGFYAPENAFEIHSDSLDLQAGIASIERQEYDSACYYLLKSAESENIPIRTEAYLYLNFIETRLHNYDTALLYLEQYHKNAMLLFNRAMEAERVVQDQKEDFNSIVNVIENQSKRRRILIGIFIAALLIVVFMVICREHKKYLIFSGKKNRELKQLTSEIKLKMEEKQAIGYSSYLLQADIFKQTPIYATIKQLEKQQENGQCRVLTYERQDLLEKELDRVFENFQKELCEIDANLTANDIKLCCLSLLPLSTYAKAVCFGSTETNIIKQRKHYIKKKMTQESDNVLLFDFIFSPR
jgi:hypothetical protein